MLKKLISTTDQLLAIISGGLVIALLGSVTTGIISRAAGRPQVWTDEAASYLMVWLAMFGWMVATRRSAHIRIRYFNDMLPGSSRRVLETGFLFVAAVIGLIIAVQGVHLVAASSDVDAITLPVSTAWLYIPLIPAGLVTLGQALADLATLWRFPNHLETQGSSS